MKHRTRAEWLQHVLALAEPLASPDLEGDGLPEWIHVVPFGEWRGHYVGEFRVREAEAMQIIANFEDAGGRHLVVDYEHQTLNAEWNGQPAPAAGWLDRLELRQDGVWAHVERWTDRAAEFLRNREYRCLSPVLVFDHANKRTGMPEGAYLHSVALTNVPFLDELTPVVNRSGHHPEESSMDLRKLLGLSEDATDAEVLAALEGLIALKNHVVVIVDADGEVALSDLPTALSERVDQFDLVKSVADLVAAEMAVPLSDLDLEAIKRTLQHSGFVSIDEHVAALRDGEKRVVQLTDEQILANAKRDGKVTPALEAWFCSHLKRDRQGALEWLSRTESKVPLSSQITAPPTPTSQPRLTDTERQVAKQLGMSDQTFAAAKEG